MFYFTRVGKEDIQKSYPANITWSKGIIIVLAQFLMCYLNCAIALAVVFSNKFKMNQWYYFVNLASVFISNYIIINALFFGITGSACQEFIPMHTFRGHLMSGKYKLGLYRRGSFLRHCVVNPLLDGTIYTVVVCATIVFTEIPKTVSIELIDCCYTLALTVGFEIVFGAIRIRIIDNGNFWSNEMIVRPICMKEKEITPVIDPNKDMPQEEPIMDGDGPYYRSFVV